MEDKIRYELFGLQLQEPMAFITNGLIAIFCLWAYRSLRNDISVNKYWKSFYLFLGVSSFLGALGHTFFMYFDIYGKMPSWILACAANVCSGWGMLKYDQEINAKNPFVHFVWIKSLILLTTSILIQKFVFVAVDAIVSYLLFTGYYALRLRKHGYESMKYMAIEVIGMLPSAFVFLFKWSPFLWLNKDDISHLLILVGIYFFYVALKKGVNQLKLA